MKNQSRLNSRRRRWHSISVSIQSLHQVLKVPFLCGTEKKKSNKCSSEFPEYTERERERERGGQLKNKKYNRNKGGISMTRNIVFIYQCCEYFKSYMPGFSSPSSSSSPPASTLLLLWNYFSTHALPSFFTEFPFLKKKNYYLYL